MRSKRFENIHSVSDIIMLMVNGLKNEWVSVDMETFGFSSPSTGRCFGCAATNTWCELMQESFTKETISQRKEKINYSLTSFDVSAFEDAINSLRKGYVDLFLRRLTYIDYLFSFKIPNIEEMLPYNHLPALTTLNWKMHLHYYEEYAEKLKSIGL